MFWSSWMLVFAPHETINSGTLLNNTPPIVTDAWLCFWALYMHVYIGILKLNLYIVMLIFLFPVIIIYKWTVFSVSLLFVFTSPSTTSYLITFVAPLWAKRSYWSVREVLMFYHKGELLISHYKPFQHPLIGCIKSVRAHPALWWIDPPAVCTKRLKWGWNKDR